MTGPGLQGRRILITRAPDDAARWAEQLASFGAVPHLLPCVRIEPKTDAATCDSLLTGLRGADCLVVMSPRGAAAIAAIAGAATAMVRGVEVAAVGAATAMAVTRWLGVSPFVARGATARALGAELVERWGRAVVARHVVVAGAEGGRTELEDALRAAGAIVTRVDVYRTIPASALEPRRDLGREGVTDVLLASPSAVVGLLNQAVVPPDAKIFAIGPTTAAAATAAGLTLAGQAATPDLEGLMEAMQCATRT